MSELKCPVLRDANRGFAAATARFEKHIARIDPVRANWRSDRNAWSVAACVDHLATASETYFDKLLPALDKARAAGRRGSAPYGNGSLVGRMIIGVLDPDRPRFKPVKTARVFAPTRGEIDFVEACNRFRGVQARWRKVLGLADGLDLGRIRLATPISPLLRITAYEAILIHVYHEPRHLTQAERIASHHDFPLG